ncbi:hypothetical protein AB7813_05615 [Tardiphaga sp. 20_F10_N6_6]|uniref:hypothetical protein n=1 Tax=Tardiphaga sp. 20_F10_N6_6 TaxID=3240788 RepID=UPI003F8C82FC
MSHVASITPSEDDLSFFVTFSDGSRYAIDLREFATGGRYIEKNERVKRLWRGDFNGRPTFARQLARMIQSENFPKTTTKRYRAGLRELFRFLDQDEASGGPPVRQLADLTDAHGYSIHEWIGPDKPFNYRSVKAVVDAMRSHYSMPPLFWPARRPDVIAAEEPMSPGAARALYKAVKAECRELKRMHREGLQLARAGAMPDDDEPPLHWSKPENRAFLAAQSSTLRLLSKDELSARGVYRALYAHQGQGPSYLSPLVGKRGAVGWSGALRWFHPTLSDIALLLWLFLIGTGWNLSTALALDVSEERNWCEAHPTNQKFVIIHAMKARSKRRQIAFSLAIPEFHPHQIIRYALEITSTLRATARYELEQARNKQAAEPTPKLAARIAELMAIIRSPWLHQSKRLGGVSAVTGPTSTLNAIIREVARRNDLVEEYPELDTITSSSPRDTWIQYAYVQSGYHVLIAQLAAFHKSPKTLKHYLKSMRYRALSEISARKLYNAVFDEISAGRLVDPTRLRLLVQNGQISDEQERRLLDLRQRTRVGAACLAPYTPPRNIAPDHVDGTLCRVQRCTGCPHGVIFADSIDLLTRAYAELVHIQRTIPFAAWSGSSFADELISLAETLKLFPASEVQDRIDSWITRFRSGELRVHDTYPSY